MEATVPIILEDSDGHITDLNVAAEQFYGWRREELLGQPMMTLVPAQYQAETDALLRRCRQGEDLRNVHSVRQRKDGTTLPVHMTVSPLTNEHGEVVGLVTIAPPLPAVSSEDAPSGTSSVV
jgi:PAS domain S-box-containing protein